MRVKTYSISPIHYNDLPDHLCHGEKTILEFGCASGLNQLISRHRDFFIENNKAGRYLGIDLEPPDDLYFNIQRDDIRTFHTDTRYDMVLVLHLLEHIELHLWSELISRLKSFVAPNGVLVIGVPNREPEGTHDYHVVTDITAAMLREYIEGAEVTEIQTRFKFAENGASFRWAFLRYIKRRLTNHPYVRRSSRLLAVWCKEVED